MLALAFYNSIVDLALVLEIGIYGASTFLACLGDITHSRLLNALVSKELSRYLNEFFTCFCDHMKSSEANNLSRSYTFFRKNGHIRHKSVAK